MPKDTHPPSFPLYVDDLISDGAVDAMTNEELGIYLRLLCKAWKEEPVGTIPNDDRVLANWGKTTAANWKKCRAGVLRAFADLGDGRLHQKRMRSEWAKLLAYRESKSKAGRKGMGSRWHGDNKGITGDITDGITNDNLSSSSSLSPSISPYGAHENLRSYGASGPYGADQPPDAPNGRTTKDLRGEYGESIDLSAADWSKIVGMAETVARRVPPRDARDRRHWFRYAAMAWGRYSENWLVDAAEAAANAGKTKKSKQAHFVAVLQENSGIGDAEFNALARTIEIPDDVWKSNALEV